MIEEKFMPMKVKGPNILLMLLDPKFPLEHRLEMLRQLCLSESKESKKIFEELLEAASSNNKKLYEKKIEELDRLISELKNGPLRPAAFLDKVATDRVCVRLQDGSSVYPLLLNKQLFSSLQRGDEVLIDRDGRYVVGKGFDLRKSGQEVSWIRRVGKEQVEVNFDNGDKHLFDITKTLLEKFERDEVKPESLLLICPRQKIAYDVVPERQGEIRYLFLDRTPVHAVIAERDIGNPPDYLEDLSDFIRTELYNPGIRRLYRLPRTITLFLTGRSGTGKSLSIEAAIYLLVSIISEVTDTPIDQIPPRVLRLRISQILSMWLGESDKRLDQFFNEVDRLYDEPFIAPDGTKYYLPVLAIGEEIEALGRTRGMDHDSVYDRIQTTLLQRLDMTRSEYKDRTVIFIFTSNVPDLIDSAFLRRIGGTIHRFEGLTNRYAFKSVLEKHMNGLPFAGFNGEQQQAIQEDIVRKMTSWLFSQNGENQRMVELNCAGSETIIKHRKDFLTGALVQRAVQQASNEACRIQGLGFENPGLTLEMLTRAFNDQIRSIVDNLSVRNVNQYVDLPDGVRVTNLRRFEQPSDLPIELMRISCA
jgi:ATP-dependent 26S proteasome regulatory subunit